MAVKLGRQVAGVSVGQKARLAFFCCRPVGLCGHSLFDDYQRYSLLSQRQTATQGNF